MSKQYVPGLGSGGRVAVRPSRCFRGCNTVVMRCREGANKGRRFLACGERVRHKAMWCTQEMGFLGSEGRVRSPLCFLVRPCVALCVLV